MPRRILWTALLLFVALSAGCVTNTASVEVTGQPEPEPVSEPAAGERLAERLDEALHRLAEHGTVVAARVLDAETGDELYATANIDQPLKPASNMKIISTAIALHTFGPEHAFKTYLAAEGNDLYVIGTGDPATGDPAMAEARDETVTAFFDHWTRALKERGITTVTGDIVLDESAFEDFHTHSSWWPEDLLYYYGAPVSAINLNDNCLDITANATAPGKPVRITLVPAVSNVEIINRMTTDDGEEPHETTRIDKLSRLNTYVLSGELKKSITVSRPVQDAALFFGDALRTHLIANGIEVTGTVRKGAWPGETDIESDERLIATHESPLPEVLARTNKPSMNLFADALAKSAGMRLQEAQGRPYPGSWLSGRRAVEAWFEEAGIESIGLVMADGSGLSHNNRVTARMISDLLLVMHHHEHAAVFKASLTIGGVDGTLRRRLTEIPGRVRGKTGTITGASALSGYAMTDDGRELIFSIIHNRNPTSRQARALQDEAVRILVHGPDWTPPTE
ncbi:D-alanyl-D-alanine carboxypeptidase/D-alanyl-D-alanine endopeptidase [Mucisphaera calidilacus]|uniref:D-alanyl-D-alanine carboxypeptidase n=1 Tax=Mucisphaera calidilacus TaxID=2527982 RepID=A0A518BWH9_9BACT|nr:D-alanyl-D-alanine carboxypeptidase/D-alanyl-D-alanine-endopeptidase [Mucisphaera calidilacus]QDU71327.1 D-alanyl-D-alanine carboxypeptidase precursor [Mucisphaera calidilacus]